MKLNNFFAWIPGHKGHHILHVHDLQVYLDLFYTGIIVVGTSEMGIYIASVYQLKNAK